MQAGKRLDGGQALVINFAQQNLNRFPPDERRLRRSTAHWNLVLVETLPPGEEP